MTPIQRIFLTLLFFFVVVISIKNDSHGMLVTLISISFETRIHNSIYYFIQIFVQSIQTCFFFSVDFKLTLQPLKLKGFLLNNLIRRVIRIIISRFGSEILYKFFMRRQT